MRLRVENGERIKVVIVVVPLPPTLAGLICSSGQVSTLNPNALRRLQRRLRLDDLAHVTLPIDLLSSASASSNCLRASAVVFGTDSCEWPLIGIESRSNCEAVI